MTILYPRAVFAYESKEFGQFFVCPNCLEFIEGDLCLECGQLYDISMDSKSSSSFQKNILIIDTYA